MSVQSFDELVAKSGDSELLSYIYEAGILCITLEIEEIDAEVLIKIPTDTIRFDNPIGPNKIFGICRIELQEISNSLQVEKGYYVPSTTFADMMKEVSSGLSLAYGRKVEETKWVLSIIGYSRLIICTVSETSLISWEVIED